DDIRTIALIGHGASGKTTLTEALLLQTGRIGSAGSVEKGNTVTDFDPLEKEHQHSLDLAVVNFDHAGSHINLIDTPGFPDFIGPAISALSAVETAAVVVNAQTGIETVTRRMMEHAAERGLCRIIIVNKIDVEGLDLEDLVSQLQDSFGSECLPLNLPTQGGSAVVDCFFNEEGTSDFGSVSDAHTAIIDQVIEMNEELMELYLEEGEEVDPSKLHDTFELALREGHLVPICFVSARTGAGVPELLDIFAKMLPSPLEGNPEPFYKGSGDTEVEFRPTADPAQHAIAHVFKVAIDPFIGKLALFRIHQGIINKDSQLFIGDGRKPFKVGHLLQVHGKDHQDIEQGVPGDICAVAKVDDIHRWAVLHDSHDEDQIRLIDLKFPTPLFGLAITVKTRGDEQKMSDTLHKLTEEDPCLTIEHNQATGETVLRGLSDLHLRLTLEKMRERYKLDVDTRPPKIAYRETISLSAEGHHRHKKQTGGAGQFGEVFLRVEPMEHGAGFEFASEVVGGAIPTSLIPAVEKGIREALPQGAIAGFPLHDIRVVATDGKHHPVDSKEIAFSTAGREAFLDAVRKAKPIVLEPIVRIRITVPPDAMGTLTGDLSSRRGRVNGSESASGGNIVIDGLVPLAEIDGYQSQLTSMTGGAGTYEIEFSHYDPVPGDIQKKLCDEYQNSQHQTD
ncbi:MAG: elongation factor G, partial [Candidatus Competibacteraceae bacterium]|nr:elongation factor G [Candidatus Competibacteraceae bacterium]